MGGVQTRTCRTEFVVWTDAVVICCLLAQLGQRKQKAFFFKSAKRGYWLDQRESQSRWTRLWRGAWGLPGRLFSRTEGQGYS
jgi:hypothetical protein